MKLHVGSGAIYLAGYRNVDLPTPRCYLAGERPDLVERYQTTAAHYYARHRDHDRMESFAAAPEAAEYVCDAYGRWDCLPCRDGEADELLSRATFEHLSQTEAVVALREAHRVLEPHGLLRLSVPDHEATLRQCVEVGAGVGIRLLLGPRNGPGGYHLQSYTETTLRAVVEAAGFVFAGFEPNPHTYPMLCMGWSRK